MDAASCPASGHGHTLGRMTTPDKILALTRVGQPFSAMKLCIMESRPVVQGIFVIRFWTGATIGGTGSADLLCGAVGSAAWLCAAFSVYLLNGVLDQAEDKANRSSRPIASGTLNANTARMIAVAAGVTGAVLMFAVDPLSGALLVAFLAVGYAYSGRPFALKQTTTGTMAGVFLLGALTYAGGYASTATTLGAPAHIVVLGGVMSLWMMLVGAQAKDFTDACGDRLAGRRTAIVRIGESQLRFVVAGSALALGVAFVSVAAVWLPVFLPSAGTMLLGAVAVAVLCLVRSWSSGDRTRLRRPYRVFMATQYLVHLPLMM